MLGVLCARPKAWLLHSGAASFHHRLIKSPIFKSLILHPSDRRRHHSPASIWRKPPLPLGEGSWNAAWDARPARWLRNPDSAWLLFGVCGCFASPPPPILVTLENNNVSLDDEETCFEDVEVDHSKESNYKVRGVPADGRCLFRAIAHMACLRNGEEAPDENRQRELADELRAQVVDELLRRREEAEWFIEGDFDAYVKRIQQPYVWGGEPELLMASHVLKAPISVFMSDRSSSELTKIANYGEEYKKDDETPINVLFHGYGHYDILEIIDRSHQKLKVEHKMR